MQHVRLAKSRNARSKQLPVMPTYKAVNQLRMAARESLKGSEGLKAQLLV